MHPHGSRRTSLFVFSKTTMCPQKEGNKSYCIFPSYRASGSSDECVTMWHKNYRPHQRHQPCVSTLTCNIMRDKNKIVTEIVQLHVTVSTNSSFKRKTVNSQSAEQHVIWSGFFLWTLCILSFFNWPVSHNYYIVGSVLRQLHELSPTNSIKTIKLYTVNV